MLVDLLLDLSDPTPIIPVPPSVEVEPPAAAVVVVEGREPEDDGPLLTNAACEGVNDGLRLCEEGVKRSVIGARGNDRRFLIGVLVTGVGGVCMGVAGGVSTIEL